MSLGLNLLIFNIFWDVKKNPYIWICTFTKKHQYMDIFIIVPPPFCLSPLLPYHLLYYSDPTTTTIFSLPLSILTLSTILCPSCAGQKRFRIIHNSWTFKWLTLWISGQVLSPVGFCILRILRIQMNITLKTKSIWFEKILWRIKKQKDISLSNHGKPFLFQ